MNFKKHLLIILTLVIIASLFTACSGTEHTDIAPLVTGQEQQQEEAQKIKLRAIIVPKFEIGSISGDFPGEAQLFYEKYCPGTEDIYIPHMHNEGTFYMNEETGVGILITGSSKTATSLALMALLTCDDYDCSEAKIISVGCAGGSEGYCTLGDVVLITAVCDNELGHSADVREMENKDADITWFHDDSYNGFSRMYLNKNLINAVYPLIENCSLKTTEKSKNVMAENYPGEEWANRNPKVIKGSSVSGDSFWKGKYPHKNAEYIVDSYDCPDPYAVTEMEEISIANAASCFNMLDRVISLRAIVNLDVFLKGETPENLWLETREYNKKVTSENSETLDIFETAMHNLFDTASIVIDAVLDGKI